VESIANIDPMKNIVPQRTAKPRPEDVDKVKGWYKVLRQIYPMRELDDAGFIIWTSILGHCDNKIMLGIIRDWISNNDKAPKPFDCRV
jgi:hypothetical protein